MKSPDSDVKAGIYITVIFHLAVLIVLLACQIGAVLRKDNSFVIDFSKQEEVEKVQKEEKLKEDIQYSIDLGFDGKLAINPKQITLINEMFSPHDIEYMKKIISIYEESGEAVLCYNNTVYEKMHIERMKRVVKEATDKLIK